MLKPWWLVKMLLLLLLGTELVYHRPKIAPSSDHWSLKPRPPPLLHLLLGSALLLLGSPLLLGPPPLGTPLLVVHWCVGTYKRL